MCERRQRKERDEPRCNVCTLKDRTIPIRYVNTIQRYLHNIRITDEKLQSIFVITRNPELIQIPDKYAKEDPLFWKDKNNILKV